MRAVGQLASHRPSRRRPDVALELGPEDVGRPDPDRREDPVGRVGRDQEDRRADGALDRIIQREPTVRVRLSATQDLRPARVDEKDADGSAPQRGIDDRVGGRRWNGPPPRADVRQPEDERDLAPHIDLREIVLPDRDGGAEVPSAEHRQPLRREVRGRDTPSGEHHRRVDDAAAGAADEQWREIGARPLHEFATPGRSVDLQHRGTDLLQTRVRTIDRRHRQMRLGERGAKIAADHGPLARGFSELDAVGVPRWQRERRSDEQCDDECRDDGAARAEILWQVTAAVVPGDPESEGAERHRRGGDRHAGDEERPAGDVQVLPASGEGQQPAPLRKVGDREARRSADGQHAHRLGHVQQARRADEDADDPELRESDQGRGDLLTRRQAQDRHEVRQVMPQQKSPATDAQRRGTLGVRR